MDRPTRPLRRGVWLAAAAALLPLAACSDARLSEMVPGSNLAMSKLECWLTLEFSKLPEGIDPRDVKVVFSSQALLSDITFDWNYIASQDQVPQGFGRGFAPNEKTDPRRPPPLSQPIKVRFPLSAKPMVHHEGTLWLEAKLFWGGKQQDSERRSIEHVYERKAGL
jgi:hypothetical protein